MRIFLKLLTVSPGLVFRRKKLMLNILIFVLYEAVPISIMSTLGLKCKLFIACELKSGKQLVDKEAVQQETNHQAVSYTHLDVYKRQTKYSLVIVIVYN